MTVCNALESFGRRLVFRVGVACLLAAAVALGNGPALARHVDQHESSGAPPDLGGACGRPVTGMKSAAMPARTATPGPTPKPTKIHTRTAQTSTPTPVLPPTVPSTKIPTTVSTPMSTPSLSASPSAVATAANKAEVLGPAPVSDARSSPRPSPLKPDWRFPEAICVWVTTDPGDISRGPDNAHRYGHIKGVYVHVALRADETFGPGQLQILSWLYHRKSEAPSLSIWPAGTVPPDRQLYQQRVTRQAFEVKPIRGRYLTFKKPGYYVLVVATTSLNIPGCANKKATPPVCRGQARATQFHVAKR